jgi:hypothetical protein
LLASGSAPSAKVAAAPLTPRIFPHPLFILLLCAQADTSRLPLKANGGFRADTLSRARISTHASNEKHSKRLDLRSGV